MSIEDPHITQMMQNGHCKEYDSYWNIDRASDEINVEETEE